MIKYTVNDFIQGGDINAKDKKNKSPLHCACWKGQTESVQFLLDNNADASEADSSLMTVLHWAVQYGHYDTLLLLLKVCSHFSSIAGYIL